MRFFINADTDGDYINDYSVRVRGRCGDSEFDVTEVMWNSGYQFNFKIDNAKFWFPKNYGEPSLYETEVTLLHKENIVDTYKLNVGIRTVELDISDSTSEDDIGEFCFKVNGRRIFAMGSNWVPLDAFHSQDTKRLGKAFEMLDDLGCNIVRCWGGNVYESDEFFDFCDRHGIMVWQDFAMGCGVYPQTLDFMNRFKEEAVYQIKRLRNHPSLALWAGDNECDIAAAEWAGFRKNTSDNEVTRGLLKKLTAVYDGSRPYLPSSPYISEGAYKTNFPLPEDHLWGPRDYFKGDFYNNAKSRFASEMGYQGFPSPLSLEKFLKQPQKIFNENGEPTDEYTVHAASPELGQKSPYIYRIGLTYSQILKLFGKAEDNFSDLIKQSQISQAEAKKYFIEKFRLKKWYCTGIIWWNLLDGWPQISDAVVDYYFCKKLAYHYIKRSQTPLCLMFGEPKGDTLTLYAVNELNCDKNISYTITEVYSGDEIAKGAASAKAGLILDGRLYSGTNDMAGEAGHIRLSDFGPVGYGKSGSFEGFCSGAGIAELGRIYAKEAFQMGKTVSYCKSAADSESITAKKIAGCARDGEADALKIFDICAEKLGAGLSIIIDILNPEAIIIGSIFQRCEELLRSRTEEVIKRETLAAARNVCKILPSKLKENLGDYAALSVAALNNERL